MADKKKAVYLVFTLSIFLPVFTYAGSVKTQKGSFEVEFGLMEKGDGCYFVCDNRRDIPFITRSENEDFSFGYTIEAEDTLTHEHYILIYLPRPIKKKTPEGNQEDSQARRRVLRSKTEKFKGAFWGRFTFNETDPKGIWVIQIFVDGRILEIIRFRVYSKK